MQTMGKLKVCEGITKHQITQLIKYTNTDSLILETTKDLERFKNKAIFDNWLKKNRKIYTFVDNSGNLLGIIWFGTKLMPKNIHFTQSLNTSHYSITFAIRLYENARGKNLSHKFIKLAWEIYSNSKEYLESNAKGIWLETNINNFAAVSAYKKVGFKLVSKPGEKGEVLMVQV